MVRAIVSVLSILLVTGTLSAQLRLEHFQCYPILDAEPEVATTVGLFDQFDFDGAFDQVKVRMPLRFCNPTRKLHLKNAHGVQDIRQHLTFYSIFPQIGPRLAVTIRNQFGHQKLLVREPVALAVPTQKLEPNFHDFPDALDHFQCYAAEGKPIRGRNAVVGLSDQFNLPLTRHFVFEPVLFCNPSEKVDVNGNTFPIRNKEAHLTCYSMSRTPFEGRALVTNQFDDQFLKLGPADTLCVPTLKVDVSLIADLDVLTPGSDIP